MRRHKLSEKVDLYYLAECISETLPNNGILVTDSGLIELIVPTNIDFKKNQKMYTSASQGSMGFVLPGIIGAYYASDRPIIAIVGDRVNNDESSRT